MAPKIKTVQIKVKEVRVVADELFDLVQLNDAPFSAFARRMICKLQPEYKLVSELSEKDMKKYGDELINLGQPLPPPEHFPDEYVGTIGKVCTGVPKKESQIAKLVKKDG